MKKSFSFKLCTVLLCFFLSFVCFASCTHKEVNPENLKKPELNSKITYTISDTERIVLLYTQEGISGEWYKNGDVKRVAACEHVEYWGYLFSREGIADYYFDIFEIDGYELFGDTNVNDEFIGEPRKVFSNMKRVAIINAGLLNSTSITLVEPDTVIPITSITTSPSNFEKWEWNETEGWSEFCSYDENTIYTIDALNISYTPFRNIGEWNIGETTLPIIIRFYEDIKAIEVYDISNYNSKLVFVANVEFNNNGEAVFKSAYGNWYNDEIDIKEIILRKNVANQN